MPMLQRVLLILTLLASPSSFAMTIVGFDGDPFYFKNGSEGIAGACHELMQKLCDREKLHCKFKIAPLSVGLEMIKSGKADVICPLAETAARKENIFFSKRIFKTRFSFFGVPQTANKMAMVKDLANYSVGVFAPSRVAESLEEIRSKSKVKFEIINEASNYSTLMRAEKITKVLAYVNQEIGTRWIEKTKSKLVQAPLAGEDVAYNIGFSRHNFTEEQSARYIRILEEIKGDKDFQASITKMHLTLFAAEIVAAHDVPPTGKDKTPEADPEGL